jgi:hypothetical protein
MPDADLSREERQLAASIDAMEKTRVYAQTLGDLVKVAEVDDWFRQHAPVIRALRDKLEGDW